MNCLQKYRAFRRNVEDGDLFLSSSSKPLGQATKWADNCYFTHAGIAFKKDGRVYAMDSHPGKGTSPAFMSHRITQQKWNSLLFLRPNRTREEIDSARASVFSDAELFIPYGWYDIPNIIAWNKFGWDIGLSGQGKVCSRFTQSYCIRMKMETFYPENLPRPIFTPEDHIRNFKDDEFTILEP